MLAKNVGITEAYTCINVERKLCTDMRKIKPKFVVLYYNKDHEYTKWHLNTAYPADSDPGAGSCKELYPYLEGDYQHERRDSRRDGRKGNRRDSQRHRAEHGAEPRGAGYFTKIIKLFYKTSNKPEHQRKLGTILIKIISTYLHS